MMDPKVFDELARRLSQSVPTGVKAVQEDVEKNLRSALAAGLDRLDLVTREEFEIQAQVLARTRAKLEAMNQRVAELERRVLGTSPEDADYTDTSYSDMDGG